MVSLSTTQPPTRRQRLGRRHLLGSMGAATALRSRRAKAATTITAWWTQGYYKAEDDALRAAVAAYEKESGNNVDLTVVTQADLNTKVIAAMTVGDVPDVIQAVGANNFVMPQAAWDDKIVDVGDVVESRKSEYIRSALDSVRGYNSVTKKRFYYGVPIKGSTMMEQAWRPLIQDAGFSDADIPKTQDAYFAFFQDVQQKLRAKGKRIFGLGYSMAGKEGDSNNLFHAFLLAYGGAGIVTPEGALGVEDPVVRKAAITAIERLTTAYKQGYVPPGAINWGDVDNNNAFYARQVVMTPNATTSISAAQKDKPDVYYKEIITTGVPLGNDGKPIPTTLGITAAFIPKGAKNIDGAKDFLRFFIQPAVLNAYLKESQGRWTPVMPSIIRNDPYWLDPNDPHVPVATRQGLELPTIPAWQVYNPAYAQVISEQVWPLAEAAVTQKNLTPEQAVEEAIKRIKTIFDRYEVR
jgi:multiple sugar transport system substrate-binding protein